jgi:glycosyltransferase involved in cell wall biosynthesis
MPNVVLEAMAAGVPVIATHVAGVTELLGLGAGSQTVAFGDAPGFIARAARLIRDTALRERVVAANRDRCSQRFSVVSMVAQYTALYEACCARL